MNGKRSGSRSGFGGTERNHAANDRVEITGGRPSLEPAILAINAVEKMVPFTDPQGYEFTVNRLSRIWN